MKKYGTLIALAVAVVFGIAAVVLANKWLTSRATETRTIVQEKVPLTQVVIAGKDLSIGSKLTAENLSLADWPKANVPKGSFYKIEEVLDRVIVTKMRAGAPVVAAELAAPGSGAGLVSLIGPGMRAMAIRVDEVIGVGGFILPNTFVDVISVQGKSKSAKTVLKKIEVLAIAQETFVEEGKAKLVRTVTLKVDLKQAEMLASTTHKGPIHLVLRNPTEKVEKPKPVAKKVVKKKRRKPAPKAPTYDIVVVRGNKSVEKVALKTTE
ncbi:MAG: Flp pilus assembly protein CpaB [Desulfuromonadales bacterium]|nr:Flp pilus assembly protein CpaB [Desulfuromonadales bacterium]